MTRQVNKSVISKYVVSHSIRDKIYVNSDTVCITLNIRLSIMLFVD